LPKAFLPLRVFPVDDVTGEGHIVRHIREIAAAAQSQRLVEGILEMAVSRLDVPVLVRLADVDAMRGHAIVFQQVRVALAELAVAGQIVHGGRQAVTAHPLGHSSGVMQGIL
jgi:hypothetical protein